MAIILGGLSLFSLISQRSFLESRSRVREPPTNKAAWEDLCGGISSNKLNKPGQILGPWCSLRAPICDLPRKLGWLGQGSPDLPGFAGSARRPLLLSHSACRAFPSLALSPHAQFLYLPAQSGTLLPYLESSQTSPHPVAHSIDSARP